MPVIALCTATEEVAPDKERVISLPWPSETRLLVERIEAVLSTSAASAAPTAPFLPSKPGGRKSLHSVMSAFEAK
jgi:hypothetical protein